MPRIPVRPDRVWSGTLLQSRPKPTSVCIIQNGIESQKAPAYFSITPGSGRRLRRGKRQA
jgi:hypothetical protein